MDFRVRRGSELFPRHLPFHSSPPLQPTNPPRLTAIISLGEIRGGWCEPCQPAVKKKKKEEERANRNQWDFLVFGRFENSRNRVLIPRKSKRKSGRVQFPFRSDRFKG